MLIKSKPGRKGEEGGGEKRRGEGVRPAAPPPAGMAQSGRMITLPADAFLSLTVTPRQNQLK